MKRSPHYAAGKFRNLDRTVVGEPGTLLDTLWRWVAGREERAPRRPLRVTAVDPSRFEAPPRSGLRITWLGHSTVLVEIDGRRVLFDPVWSERCSPSTLVGPARFHSNPLDLDRIPRLDAVVVSHDHYDHLDETAVRAIAGSGVPFFVPLGVGAHLERWGIPGRQVRELDWWEETVAGGGRLTLVATPARHFSGRGILDANATLWASWVLLGPEHRIYFSGDTGWFEKIAEIGSDYGPFDATLLEIGAYDDNWRSIHLGPEQAVKAHQQLRGGLLVPIHWGTFNLALHAWYAPVDDLLRQAAARGVSVAVPRLGQSVEPTRPPAMDRWWRP